MMAVQQTDKMWCRNEPAFSAQDMFMHQLAKHYCRSPMRPVIEPDVLLLTLKIKDCSIDRGSSIV
jgi:hypothetical protein